MFLRFSRRIIHRVLSREELAKVKILDTSSVHGYQQAIAAKYPALSGVYAVADGLKLQLEQSGDAVIQSMFYK